MANYSKPTQDQFNRAEQTLLDVLATKAENVLTKTGSVVRELLVRPFAFLYSWLSANFSETLDTATIGFLKTSNRTDNTVADQLASNYFVSRREGSRSKGVITLRISAPTLHLPAGSSFTVESVQVLTETRIIARYRDGAGLRGSVLYVNSFPSGVESEWLVNIPVVAGDAGNIEIKDGYACQPNFANSLIISATLTSPLTGGADTETDAELMRRAEFNTAESGVGSYYGIRKKLATAPINVMDIGLLAGEDTLLYRARRNGAGINPGGYIDCYVKTQKQASTGTVYVKPVKSGDNYTATITPEDAGACAGFFCVRSITATIGGVTSQVKDWSVAWESSTLVDDGESARLGIDQQAVITFPASAVDATETADDDLLSVVVSYMPGIRDLQYFIESDNNRFIGQDIAIKAAIPVVLNMRCEVRSNPELSAAEQELLKQVISDTASNYRIGTKVFNFSDIRLACSQALPRAELRLPCSISAEVITKSGGLDTFHSTSGLLDISCPVNKDAWESAVCFFSLNPENIDLEQL